MMRIQIGDAIVKSCSDVNEVDLSMRVVVCVKGNVQLNQIVCGNVAGYPSQKVVIFEKANWWAAICIQINVIMRMRAVAGRYCGPIQVEDRSAVSRRKLAGDKLDNLRQRL